MRRLRNSLLLVALCGLLFFIWQSARAGYAALLTTHALSARDIGRAHTAVSLSPGNPRAHIILGALLEANGDLAAALPHYQTAVQLRPQDYVLWMQLARGQELAGDTQSAINSGTMAVGLAPFYAQPHWQLGNILVRAGRADGGFSELRMAGASDPTLLPGIIDLAWQLSGGKVDYVLAATQPHTPESYKALAAYLKKHDQVRVAIQMFRAAGSAADEERRAYLSELISAGKFMDAHLLWGHPIDPDGPLMFDGGFEGEIDLDEPGFGWRSVNLPKSLTLSLDNTNPKAGRSSLKVDFNGEMNPSAPVISQLVLTTPRTHYQLHFAVRTEGIVSGGLPNVTIVDAKDNKLLGQTGALPQTTNGWRDTTIDFTTGETTTAIQIALQRQPCSTQQCPIFGRLWLDDFFLE